MPSSGDTVLVGIYEVELMLGLNQAMDLYMAEYERRYKVKPVLQNKFADATVIKDLIRNIGLDKTCEAIKTYLKMNDDWFVKKCHSLKVLQDNINPVLAKLAKTPVHKPTKAFMVAHVTFCDKCKESFSHVYDANAIPDPPYYCQNCG